MNEVLSHGQLTEVAKQFGTPVYIYHAEKIAEQYQKLKAAFNGQDVIFFYASKALTNVNILRYILDLGANVDCSSINEVKLAIYAGFLPENIFSNCLMASSSSLIPNTGRMISFSISK